MGAPPFTPPISRPENERWLRGSLVAGTPRGPLTGEQVLVLGTPAAGRGDGVQPDTPAAKREGALLTLPVGP